MTDENGYPLKLEGMGTVRFHWGSITRDKAKSLTIQLNDNFAGEERRLILKLSTEQGLYSEQIFIQQKICTNYYQIECITYSLDEFDGVREAGTKPWGITWIDRTGSGEEGHIHRKQNRQRSFPLESRRNPLHPGLRRRIHPQIPDKTRPYCQGKAAWPPDGKSCQPRRDRPQPVFFQKV